MQISQSLHKGLNWVLFSLFYKNKVQRIKSPSSVDAAAAELNWRALIGYSSQQFVSIVSGRSIIHCLCKPIKFIQSVMMTNSSGDPQGLFESVLCCITNNAWAFLCKWCDLKAVNLIWVKHYNHISVRFTTYFHSWVMDAPHNPRTAVCTVKSLWPIFKCYSTHFCCC